MSDLTAGNFADIVLTPGQTVRIVTSGACSVQSKYGAPAGTTTVTAASRDFGPYDVPAQLRLTATSGTASYSLVQDQPATLTAAQVAAGATGAVAATASGLLLGPNGSSVSGAGILSVRPGTSASDLNAAILGTFGSLGSASIGGEIVFQVGVHPLESSIFVPYNVSVRFVPGAKVVPPAGAAYTNGYVFCVNSLDGVTWNVAFPNVYGAVFEGAYLDNLATPATVAKLAILGAPHDVSNIRGAATHGLVHTVGAYFDKFQVDGYHVVSPQGADYQIKLANLGDGLRISRGAVNTSGADTALMISLFGCQGGVIDAAVQGTIKAEQCRALTIRGKHGENNGLIELKDTDAVVDGCYFWRRTTPRVIITGTTRRVVRIKDSLFLHDITQSTVVPSADIQTRPGVELVIDNSFGGVTENGAINNSQQHGVTVCQSDGVTAVAAFNQFAYQLTRKAVLNGYNVIDGYFPMACGSGNITTGFPAAQSSSKSTWQEATGTYYYQAAAIWDVARALGKAYTSAERSLALTNGGNCCLLPFSGLARSNTAMLRVYRGTTAGSYDKYVDIPITNSDSMYDTGLTLNGYAWVSRTAGAVDTLQDINALDIRPDGRAVVRFTAAPTAGTFVAGDLCEIQTPAAGAAASWRFTGAAWKQETALAA